MKSTRAKPRSLPKDENAPRLAISEVSAVYGVSLEKVRDWVQNGTLKYTTDPLDRRVKMVAREDIERLIGDSEISRRRRASNKIAA